MFEKFTERARKVMSISRQEAQRLNSEFIGTEHMLLGIIDEGGGVAAKALKKLKVDLKRVRQEIEKLITPSTSPVVTIGQLPFSPRAKRVMELAGEASSVLGRDYLGTEHLLLGLIKENEGIAAQVLINLGLKLDEVRDAILEILGADVIEVPGKAETIYAVTITPGLEQKQIEEILSAIRMIKCVSKVEKTRGLWVEHDVFESVTTLTKLVTENLTQVAEALNKLADRMAKMPEEKKEVAKEGTEQGGQSPT